MFSFQIKKRDSFYLLKDKEIVGDINFFIVDNTINLNLLEIYRPFRRKGYGKAFLKLLLKQPNISRICGQSSLESVGFYKSFNNHKIEYNGYDDTFYFTIIK